MNFMAQLIWFYKRLHGDSYDGIPVSPRVFLVSSHEPEDPYRISSRLIMDNLYQGEKSKLLDSRAVFIIQGPSSLYLWTGSNVFPGSLDTYTSAA
jgi:hypothetical protein